MQLLIPEPRKQTWPTAGEVEQEEAPSSVPPGASPLGLHQSPKDTRLSILGATPKGRGQVTTCPERREVG